MYKKGILIMKKLDLVGRRFGKGIVLECIGQKIAGNKSHRTYKIWHLICDCGNTYETLTPYLLSGNSNSCGCLRHKDLTNERYGFLVVIKFHNRIIKNKRSVIIWECLCDCGKTHNVQSEYLLNGDVISCGCYVNNLAINKCPNIQIIDTNNNRNKYKSIHSYFGTIKSGAKKRNISITITAKDIEQQLIKQNYLCALSNHPISLLIPCTASLDRINNDEGYHKNNIQWVHRSINYMKGTMTVKSFVEWCQMVYGYMKI